MNENTSGILTGKRVVIAGASGFLGQACLCHLHGLGAEVMALSRRRPGLLDQDGYKQVRWLDWSEGPGSWHGCLDGAFGVVNLIGRSVDCRKTPANCDAILRSRLDSVRWIGEALGMAESKPSVWVQASTAHIYGDPADARLGDDAATGWGLAPFVGKAWEKAFTASLPAATRGVALRTSFVIGKNGGALPVLARLARLGLGGKAGHGRQGFSWIHLEDFCRVVEHALLDASMSGSINVSSTHPCSQDEFMRALRKAVGMPFGLPGPAWLIRLAARCVVDTDPDLVLEGRYILPSRLVAMEFPFAYPRIDDALDNLLGHGGCHCADRPIRPGARAYSW